MIIYNKEILFSEESIAVNGIPTETRIYSVDTIVVGSGAAGLNCADLIMTGTVRKKAMNGEKLRYHEIPVAVVTEGLNMGTSRNTGSDKQTYYKLTMSGDSPDSVGDMARSLFNGGSVDGDLALTEAAGSARAFLRLVDLGVPFPYNDYGEFAGYRTDHDTRTRATSCGPLTSKYMTEALERSAREHGVPVFDGYRVIKALTDGGKITGLVAVSPDEKTNRYGLAIFRAENYVFATGGPSAVYSATVYPESQTCSHGVLLGAGAPAVNVTESQYGIASVKFRWNLSGTYQQALPRYFSVNEDGSDEREFLTDMIPDPKKLLTEIFRKGYQWPFDPAKLDRSAGNDSSLIDIAVYREKMKGRRVFLDFRRNPSCFDFSLLEDEPKQYLENSGGLRGTPVKRLAAMNPPAIELYRSHGIDLYSEPLEVDICAQHNNGGFEVNTDFRSIGFENLYVIGEAAGVFGVHRPGGSALNSTQVGSRRAAEAILASNERMSPLPESIRIPCVPTINNERGSAPDLPRILEKRLSYGRRMSSCGAFIRNITDIRAAIPEIRAELELFDSYQADSPETLRELSINRDILLTQLVYLSAILGYAGDGGLSRGSYLISDSIPDGNTPVPIDTEHFTKICRSRLGDDMSVDLSWRSVRPIPKRDDWFETVWKNYREKNVNSPAK